MAVKSKVLMRSGDLLGSGVRLGFSYVNTFKKNSDNMDIT